MRHRVDKGRLKTLWLQGVKAEAIACELGITYQTLRKACQRLGLPARKPPYIRPTHPQLSERGAKDALVLWRKGWDTLKIANRIRPDGGEAAVYNTLLARRGNVLPVGAGDDGDA